MHKYGRVGFDIGFTEALVQCFQGFLKKFRAYEWSAATELSWSIEFTLSPIGQGPIGQGPIRNLGSGVRRKPGRRPYHLGPHFARPTTNLHRKFGEIVAYRGHTHPQRCSDHLPTYKTGPTACLAGGDVPVFLTPLAMARSTNATATGPVTTKLNRTAQDLDSFEAVEKIPPQEDHLESVDQQDNLVYDNDETEPELHARTYVAIAAVVFTNFVSVFGLNAPPAVVSESSHNSRRQTSADPA